jgi:hypothetical protein
VSAAQCAPGGLGPACPWPGVGDKALAAEGVGAPYSGISRCLPRGGVSWSEGCFLPSSNCRGFGAQKPALVTGSGSACREQVRAAARGTTRTGGSCRSFWERPWRCSRRRRQGRRSGVAECGVERRGSERRRPAAASEAASESDAGGVGERGLEGGVWSGLGWRHRRRRGARPGRRRLERPRVATLAASGSAAYLFPFSSASCCSSRLDPPSSVASSFQWASPTASLLPLPFCHRFDSSAFSLGCPSGPLASTSPAWRGYPLACASSFSFLLTPITHSYKHCTSSAPCPHFPGSGNSSTTNHGGCFPPSSNRGRASVSRKGDAGPHSPRVLRGALLARAASFGLVIPFRGGQVVSSHFPTIRKRSSRWGRCDARGAVGLAAARQWQAGARQ